MAVVCLTPAGDAVYVNEAFSSLTGLSRKDSHRQGWAQGLDRATLVELLRRMRTAGGSFDCVLRTPEGRRWTRWSWLEPAGVDSRVVTIVDLTVDHRREAVLSRLASRDPLTGVANRRTFLEQLRIALHREDHRQVGVVYIDLDGFKDINDGGGHALGDQVLRLVAQRFVRHLRTGDLLGRMGGDEFAVLCVGPPAEIMSMVERMSKALHDPFTVAGSSVTVSATVGVAVAAGPSDPPEDLLSRADRAMYDAKGSSTGKRRSRSTIAMSIQRSATGRSGSSGAGSSGIER